MVQKKLPLINSAHGTETRNIINELIKLFNSMGYTYDEALQKAHDVLKEAQKTNDMNKNVQQQINTLIAESGTSDAEVLQARGGFDVLNSRLVASEERLGSTPEVYNVKSMGAKGDGTTDDYAAIQGAISLAEVTGRSVYIPAGTYYCSKTLRTNHRTTPHYTTGYRIYGDGRSSVITGNGAKPVDYSDLTKASDGAAFALHGVNTIVDNIAFRNCTVGVFLGQHPDVTEQRSSVSFNIVENVWVERVGTGILAVHSLGNNYNKFKKIHVLACQIGVHLGNGIHIDQYNNNRNTFEDIRVSYGWIGYLIEQADGNVFNGIYAENLVETNDVTGPAPAQLPAALGGKKTAVVVLDGQYNFFDKVAVENCEWHIYSVGYKTLFDNMLVRDDSKARSLVMFPLAHRQPLHYSSDSQINPFYTYQPDNGIHFEGSNGAAIKSRMFDLNYQWQSVNVPDLSAQIGTGGAGNSRIRRLGGMFSWFANLRFPVTSSTASTDDLKINLPFGKDFTLNPVYYHEVSNGATFSFPAYVGYNTDMELIRGRFATNYEIQNNNGIPFIVLKAPTVGWNKTNAYNQIIFELNYYYE